MIEDLLEEITNNPGVLSCGIFDGNGLLICSMGDRKQLEKITSSMHRLIDDNSKQLNSLEIEPVDCITLIGEKGISLFWPLKNSSSLALMAQSESNLGEIRRVIKPLLSRLRDLIK